MTLTELILFGISSLYILFIVIRVLWTIHWLKKVDTDKPSIAMKINDCILIIIYSLNQATNVSLIVYFYEIGNIQFFIVSLTLFIVYRFITSRTVTLQNRTQNNFVSFILHLIYDYNLYRSLLLQYLCQTSVHQKLLFQLQTTIITPIQFIFCLISILSEKDNNTFIIWYTIIMSSLSLLINATNPTQRYEKWLRFPCYITDIFAQIFIFTLIYLTCSYIIFYMIIILKTIIITVVSYYRAHSDTWIEKDAYWLGIWSIYILGYEDIEDNMILLYTSFGWKFICCILVTMFMHLSIFNDCSEIYLQVLALLIISYIMIILTAIIAFCQDYNWWQFDPCDCMNSPYLKLDVYSSYQHKGWELRYFGGMGTKQEFFKDVMISKHLIKDREHAPSRRNKTILLLGNGNNASCKIYKKILIERNDYNEDIDAMKRVCCVYGFVHQFEIIENVKYYIPNEIVGCIVSYFGVNDDICFCCYDNKIIEFREEKMRKKIKLIHIHEIYRFIPKCLPQFTEFTGCGIIIYCISLLSTYNDDDADNIMTESINKFDIIVNYPYLERSLFILLFTEYNEFKAMIENGVALQHNFDDYDGNVYSVDEWFRFIQQKYIDRDRRIFRGRPRRRTSRFLQTIIDAKIETKLWQYIVHFDPPYIGLV